MLAGIMADDPDSLLCDMAETYHVYDIRAIPLRTAAALALGLGPDSRTMRRISGSKATMTETLLAVIADGINTLVWFKTKDGQKGRNRPRRLLDYITGKAQEKKAAVFATAGEFEEARKRILMEVV